MIKLLLSLKERMRCLGWIQERGDVSASFVPLTTVDMTSATIGKGGYPNHNSNCVQIYPPGWSLLLAALIEILHYIDTDTPPVYTTPLSCRPEHQSQRLLVRSGDIAK